MGNYSASSDKKGEMITGWFYNKEHKYYYLQPNTGTMVRNDTIKIDRVASYFNKNGVWGADSDYKQDSKDKSEPKVG
ncbi:hypothetical protein [Bacillus thuringiensis]|uniref:hypothetical protein n=1 Tax=Bacillus thuringiensis TaxID=1428 RepID=UPI0020D28B67|nr:hypothetical protein [Bacillus thuringiensis]